MPPGSPSTSTSALSPWGGGLLGGLQASDIGQFMLMRLLLGKTAGTALISDAITRRRAERWGSALNEVHGLVDKEDPAGALSRLNTLLPHAGSDVELAMANQVRERIRDQAESKGLGQAMTLADQSGKAGNWGEAASIISKAAGAMSNPRLVALANSMMQSFTKRAEGSHTAGTLYDAFTEGKGTADPEVNEPPMLRFLGLARARGVPITSDDVAKLRGVLTPGTDVREVGGSLVGVTTEPLSGTQTTRELTPSTSKLDPTKDADFRKGAAFLAASTGKGVQDILGDPKLVAQAYEWGGEKGRLGEKHAVIAKSLGINKGLIRELTDREADDILTTEYKRDLTNKLTEVGEKHRLEGTIPIAVLGVKDTVRNVETGERMPGATRNDLVKGTGVLLSEKEDETYREIQTTKGLIDGQRERLGKLLATNPGENIPNAIKLAVQRGLASNEDLAVFERLRDALGVKLGAIYNRGRPTEPDAQKFAALMGTIWDTKGTGLATIDTLRKMLDTEEGVLLGRAKPTVRTPDDLARSLGISPAELEAMVILRSRKGVKP